MLVNGSQFYVFGDAVYLLRPRIQISFDIIAANDTHINFNTYMRSVRVTLEYSYSELKQIWGLNDYAIFLKVFNSPIGLIYTSSALLLKLKDLHQDVRSMLTPHNPKTTPLPILPHASFHLFHQPENLPTLTHSLLILLLFEQKALLITIYASLCCCLNIRDLFFSAVSHSRSSSMLSRPIAS